MHEWRESWRRSMAYGCCRVERVGERAHAAYRRIVWGDRQGPGRTTAPCRARSCQGVSMRCRPSASLRCDRACWSNEVAKAGSTSSTNVGSARENRPGVRDRCGADPIEGRRGRAEDRGPCQWLGKSLVLSLSDPSIDELRSERKRRARACAHMVHIQDRTTTPTMIRTKATRIATLTVAPVRRPGTSIARERPTRC